MRRGMVVVVGAVNHLCGCDRREEGVMIMKFFSLSISESLSRQPAFHGELRQR